MLDKTYKDTWNTRGMTPSEYRKYLESDEWKEIKRKAKERDHYKKCWVCKTTTKRLEIHHRSYKWIGTKNCMMGLVALCRDCHEEIHNYAKVNNLSVRLATYKIFHLSKSKERTCSVVLDLK